MRPQQLPRHIPLCLLLDAHDCDREIAGDAVGPEPGRTSAAGGHILRDRAQRAIVVKHAIGQTLEEMRLVLGDLEVV